MVKLIRITTEDDGNYNAALQDGIQLGSNSSIALQNLTFESNFVGLKISSSNNEVVFNLDIGDNQNGIPAQPAALPPPATAWQPEPPFTSLSVTLSTAEYGKTNYTDFFDDLQGALNSCLAVGTGIGEEYADIYSEFFVDYFTDPARPMIYYKYVPQTMPFFFNNSDYRDGTTVGVEGELFLINPQTSGDPSIALESVLTDNHQLLGNMTRVDTTPTATTENCIFPRSGICQWSRGSAFWGCNVYNIDNTAGGASNLHGFGIGLSFTDLEETVTDGQEIPDFARDFEILIEKGNAVYRYISPTNPNTEEISTIMPYKYNITDDPNQITHDRIIFERKGSVITGCIWAHGTAAAPTVAIRHELFTYTLTNEQRNLQIYPYIWIKGVATQCTVGRPIVTPSTLIYDIIDKQFVNNDFEITGQVTTFQGTGFNYFEEVKNGGNGMINVVPLINNNRMIQMIDNRPRLVLSGEVLRFLGWDVVGNTPITIDFPRTRILMDDPINGNSLGFVLEGEKDFQIVNADNYVVLIDSNPVQSYDASRFSYGATKSTSKTYNEMRGRQLNILATIPVNNNSGYVEYRANELVYIDIDNRYPLELKNLRLRVLDRNLDPIAQIGVGVMTLLIKDQ